MRCMEACPGEGGFRGRSWSGGGLCMIFSARITHSSIGEYSPPNPPLPNPLLLLSPKPPAPKPPAPKPPELAPPRLPNVGAIKCVSHDRPLSVAFDCMNRRYVSRDIDQSGSGRRKDCTYEEEAGCPSRRPMIPVLYPFSAIFPSCRMFSSPTLITKEVTKGHLLLLLLRRCAQPSVQLHSPSPAAHATTLSPENGRRSAVTERD